MINTNNLDDFLNEYNFGYNMASKVLGYNPVDWLEIGVQYGYSAIASAINGDSED